MSSRGTTLRVTSFVLVFPLFLLVVSLLIIFLLAVANQLRRWYMAFFDDQNYTISRTAAMQLVVNAATDKSFSLDASNAVAGPVATVATHAAHASNVWSFAAMLKFLNVTPLGFSLSSTLVLLAVVVILVFALRLMHYKQFTQSVFDTYMERLSEIRFPIHIHSKTILSWLNPDNVLDNVPSVPQDAKRSHNVSDLASSSSALSPSSLPTHTRLQRKLSSPRLKTQGQTGPRSRSGAAAGHVHPSPQKHEPVANSLSSDTISSEVEVVENGNAVSAPEGSVPTEEPNGSNKASVTIQVMGTLETPSEPELPRQPQPTAQNHESVNESIRVDDHHPDCTNNAVNLGDATSSPLNADDDKPVEPGSALPAVNATAVADDSNDEGKFVAAGEKRRRKKSKGNAKARIHQHQEAEATSASQPQPQHSTHKNHHHANSKRHATELVRSTTLGVDATSQQQHNPNSINNVPNESMSREGKRHHRHSYPGRSVSRHQTSNDYIAKRASVIASTVAVQSDESAAKPAVSTLSNNPWTAAATQHRSSSPSLTYAHITAHHPQQQQQPPVAQSIPNRTHSLFVDACPTRSPTPTVAAISPATPAVSTNSTQWYSPFSTGLNIDLALASLSHRTTPTGTVPSKDTFTSSVDRCAYTVGSGFLGAVGRAKAALEDEEKGTAPEAAVPATVTGVTGGWGLFGGSEAPLEWDGKEETVRHHRRVSVGAVGTGRVSPQVVANAAECGKHFSFFDRALSFSQVQ